MFDPLPLKAAIAFAAALLLLAAIYFFVGIPSPMLSGSLGSRWECDATRGGAVTCARDAKPPHPSHNPSSPANAGDPHE